MAVDGSHSTNSLIFLCWLDTFERIDTLLLEIRHVQETIASQLHEKTFYEPLRYEDHYLWGRYAKSVEEHGTSQDWYEVLASPRLPQCSIACSVLAALWCPEYPPVPDAKTFFERLDERKDDGTKETDIYKSWADIEAHRKYWQKLYDRKKELSTVNLFSANEDRLYDSLRYLQLLKRDILRDKLVLAYRALETFTRPSARFFDDERLTRFAVVRRVAMHSLHLRLDAFRDILSAVQEILNLSIERDPPPTVRRRRDQGIYTTDLADNCRFIERDVKNFFAAVADPIKDVDERIMEFIVHRYTRNYTSTHRYENIWTSTLPGHHEQRLIGAGFVQSSFWMPERPDLQPIIAHEIAHLFLKSKHEDLRPRALDESNDSLSKLLRQMSYVFEFYSNRFKYFPFSARMREGLLREIASDLVGSAVHRTSYLFANFLELLCFGCEAMILGTKAGDIAYDISELGEEYITLIRNRRPEWTIRLKATLAFSNMLRIKTGRPAEALEASLHVGIEGVIDATLRQLSNWMDAEQREDWGVWMEMTNVIADLVKDSVLVDEASQWLRKRSAASESTANRLWNDPLFNRYLPRLPDSIVKHCLGAWLDRLVEEPRMLGRILNERRPPPHEVNYDDVVGLFRELYFDAPSTDRTRPETGLFNHLIDIPWQTALLTARDFIGAPPNNSAVARATRSRPHETGVPQNEHIAPLEYNRWLACIHEFNWLGRDLYELALEYAVWYERPSIGRLRGMNRWLNSICKSMKALLDEERDENLSLLATLLNEILDGPAGAKLKRLPFADLIERWLTRRLHRAEHIEWGSRAISDYYPTNDRSTAANSKYKDEEWTHFFDYLATKHMDDAGERISTAVTTLIKKRENAQLVNQLAEALRRPIHAPRPFPDPAEPMRRRLVQYGQILSELIRVAYYLEIRPEKSPGGLVTAHHTNGGKLGWSGIFARYLDVPIQPRKRVEGPGSARIEVLVPTRSVRVDRISQLYHVHMSSLAIEHDQHSLRYPGHLARDNLMRGRELYWIPWDEHGVRPAGERRVRSTRLGTPLLGRFDRLMIEPAKNTARFQQYSPSMPYFRREQTGLPFAATVTAEGIDRADEHPTLSLAFRNVPLTFVENFKEGPAKGNHSNGSDIVPLATLSILLVQRSARLTFVERLLAEDVVMKSFHPCFSSPYGYFKPQSDIGLLTDGWGDIFLVLFGKLDGKVPDNFDEYVQRCEAIGSRFDEIITLRKSIFEDTLVVRSETSYTPLAIDTALLNPRKFRSTISIRFIATRDGASLAEKFEDHMYDLFRRQYGGALWEILSYSSMSGRNDYVITTRQHKDEALPARVYKELCAGCSDYRAYGIIFETLRNILFEPEFIRMHVDTTTTTIGELTFPKY